MLQVRLGCLEPRVDPRRFGSLLWLSSAMFSTLPIPEAYFLASLGLSSCLAIITASLSLTRLLIGLETLLIGIVSLACLAGLDEPSSLTVALVVLLTVAAMEASLALSALVGLWSRTNTMGVALTRTTIGLHRRWL